jgi:polyphosphate kinase
MNFINRELSWLDFNQRVLDEGGRPDKPLLERLKFLAITASNLDEFFQVRVGGLAMMRRAGSRVTDSAGLTPAQQMTAIRKRVLQMIDDQFKLLNEDLLPSMAKEGIVLVDTKQLTPSPHLQAAAYFSDFVFPLLTPLAVDPDGPRPDLPSLQIIIACRLEQEDGTTRIAFVPIGDSLPRFVPISAQEGDAFIYIEDLVRTLVGELFPGETVVGTAPFRITRNSDIAVQEEDVIDLAGEMEEVLATRRLSDTIRIQISSGTPRDLLNVIQEVTGTGANELYRLPGPLALTDFMKLCFLPGYELLCDEAWLPQPSPLIDPGTSMLDTIAERDIFLIHPFESFEPVVRLLEEAAVDPNVLAIKQVLYRTASDSRIIRALTRAAQNGKQVTVLVELKARFDEERNLQRAETLQRAGVRIVYGVKGLKTHAKVTLIARNENGRLRRYVHLGTGNYNESTAQLYTDLSYLTCRPEYGADASLIFNAVTGRSKLVRLKKLFPAPTLMKKRILELIETETDRANHGEKARIMAKMNSLQDPDIINALYKASRAGVDIKLNVRGICCLKPGRRKAAKNIRVVSIIDRLLEHARAFYFHHGGTPEVLIASADWMTRNLEKRVELLVPIEDPASRRRLIRYLEACFKDNTNTFEIQSDGTSKRVGPAKSGKRFRLQEHLQKEASKAAKARQQDRATTFEPHLPPDQEQ